MFLPLISLPKTFLSNCSSALHLPFVNCSCYATSSSQQCPPPPLLKGSHCNMNGALVRLCFVFFWVWSFAFLWYWQPLTDSLLIIYLILTFQRRSEGSNNTHSQTPETLPYTLLCFFFLFVFLFLLDFLYRTIYQMQTILLDGII